MNIQKFYTSLSSKFKKMNLLSKEQAVKEGLGPKQTQALLAKAKQDYEELQLRLREERERLIVKAARSVKKMLPVRDG